MGHAKFTYNHLYIMGVFMSLAMASVPPNFGVFRDSARYISLVPVLGVFFLLLTFFYPSYNYWSYYRIRNQLLKVEPETKDAIQKHRKEADSKKRRDTTKLRSVSGAHGGSMKRTASASLDQPFG